MPSSQPLMTCPTPIVNWNGRPRLRELSNSLPSVRQPAAGRGWMSAVWWRMKMLLLLLHA